MRADFFVTFIGRMGAVGVAFLTSVVVTRLMSRELAGFYFWLVSCLALVTIAQSLGIAAVAAGRLAQCEKDGGLVQARQLAMRLSNSVLLCVLATALSALGLERWAAVSGWVDVPKTLRWWPGLLVASGGVAYGLVMAEVLRYFGWVRTASAASGLASNVLFLGCVIAAALASVEITPERLLWAYAVCAAVAALVLLGCLCRLHGGWASGLVDRTFLWHTSVPVVLSNVGAFVITQAHTLVAALALSAIDNAAYGAAARLVLIVGLIPAVMQSVLVPMAGRAYAGGDLFALEIFMRRSATLMALVVLPVSILLVSVPGLVLDRLFGPGYSDAAWVLRLLAIGAFYNVARGFPGLVLMQIGFQHEQARLTFVGALASVMLLALAWYIGRAEWIALAVVLATVVQGSLEHRLLRARVGVFPAGDWRLLGNPLVLWRSLHVR